MTQNIGSDVAALEAEAIAHLKAGRQAQALALWSRVLQQDGGHVIALAQLGQAAFNRGEFATARAHLQAAAERDGSKARQWTSLALCAQKLGDDAGEEAALFKALTLDPYDLLALALRGALYERQGKKHLAAASYGAVVAVAPPLEQLPPDLRAAVAHALRYGEQHRSAMAGFLDDFLAPHLAQVEAASSARFRTSLDILLGRKRRFDSQPMRYFVPGLPAIEFFERRDFPWLDAVEAGTEDIRNEFLAVLRDDERTFTPYIEYSADQPVAQWKELNHNPRWSAYHLVKDGVAVPGHAERCPRTMEILQRTPRPEQAGRTPVALFSVLKPHTRIPAHVGASNCRLLVHLPLIVPAGCRYRVGNEERLWEPGRAWVFDDTVEHEAWNDSDQMRVVLIFDTWHPMLSGEERHLISALSVGLNAFSAGVAEGSYDV